MEGNRRDNIVLPGTVVRFARIIAATALRRADAFFETLEKMPADPRRHVEALARAEGPHALYVHMPFCHQPLCRFCCFVRYPFDREMNRSYMKALAAEATWLASTAEAAKVPLVYIGGGTPSIDVYALAELVDVLRSYFGRGIDVSTEASPLDIDDEAVQVLRSAGVKRLSIGIQALSNERLRRLGRLSNTVEDALRAVEAARGRFETLNIDIVWGIASDTPETVYNEARRALELGASQVTFYPLMPAPGLRRLLRERREGPWHPMEPRLYEAVLQAARDAGYRPATPWCMDQGSELIDEYVVDYDRFLAIGLSAIGRTEGYIYVNTFTPERYVKLVAERGHAAALAKKLTVEEDMLYYASSMAFGLRWCPEQLRKRYGLLARGLNAMVAAALRILGEQKRDGSCYVLETPGSLYAAHAVQRSIYMAVNGLREWGMKTGA
ncbi:hypothetical protein Pyrde_0835 [Pyrodictium delaneyi]|uniref:Radical SAM protein n=1 Tax=Pyrodictium delaneyi TaxID=1273541 RepID=A0A0P0N2V6_9CREN|nr:radical SAM protein [Pyrodictium delaneyi]ALL00885.1 hypothetical protein Pyrde_0835 [Pyrodictium delaneyi]OWJ55493.1 radical SAM protein [Pyrodictium delaneyi]